MPALRTVEEVVDQSAIAAVEAAGARGGTCVFWGERPPREARSGDWPDEAQAWLLGEEECLKKEASPGSVSRLHRLSYHVVAITLGGSGQASGLLALCSSSPFDDSQEEDLRNLALASGLSLENLTRANRSLRRLDQLALLYDVGKAMNSILDIRKLLDEIMHRGQETLMAEACSVLLVDEERQELFFEMAKGEAGAALQRVRMKKDQGIAGWIATNGEPVVINDVNADPRFFGKVDQEVKFVTRSILGVPLLSRGKTIGVIEVLNKREGHDFSSEDLELLTALAADAAVSIENARLFQAVLDGYLDTIRALAAAVDAKDPYTAGHVDRVSSYAIETGEVMGLPEDEMTALRYGAILHDVGKIGIADAVLGKPGPLTREEFQIMSTHPEIGSRMLEGIGFLSRARPVARHHHETWDGKGYPEGLKGTDIPQGARIVGAVDAFDAMTTDRPYRKALTVEFALGELRNKAGIQFDTEVVEAFAKVLQRRGLIH